MENTIPDIRQLFNAKSIGYGVTPDALTEGQIGIYALGSETSILEAGNLPPEFNILIKANGRILRSFDTINKANIFNKASQNYAAEVVNKWETIVEGKCKCIKGIQVNLNFVESQTTQELGYSAGNRDFVVEVAPEDLNCLCTYEGQKKTYENNVYTMVIARAINNKKSPFYKAVVLNATTDAVVEDVEAFVEANKAANLDDSVDDGPMLKLVVEGLPQPGGHYADLDVNYVYPRGVRMTPVMTIDGLVNVFTETQELVYEKNSGYDLRQEEFENMNFYTKLNFRPQICGGIASPDLLYQFESSGQYNTVTFDFGTKKVERNTGETRTFSVLIASTVPAVTTKIKSLFSIL